MRIRRPHVNVRAAFSDFSTLRPIFKKVCFQALHLQDPCGQSAKPMQKIVRLHKRAFPCGRAQRIEQTGEVVKGKCHPQNGVGYESNFVPLRASLTPSKSYATISGLVSGRFTISLNSCRHKEDSRDDSFGQ